MRRVAMAYLWWTQREQNTFDKVSCWAERFQQRQESSQVLQASWNVKSSSEVAAPGTAPVISVQTAGIRVRVANVHL